MDDHLLDLLADLSNPIFFGIFLLALRCKLKSGIKSGIFLVVTLVALGSNYVLSHLHQWFHLWPEHGDFVSGHMAFLLTLATSLFLLDWRSLMLSVPFVIAYGFLIVGLGYHQPRDLLFAAGLAVPVTLGCHWFGARKCFGGSDVGI